MSAIEDVYADLETDISLEEFRDAVEEKVDQMGGLADEETAAMLIAHELNEGKIKTISDIGPGMDEAKFLAKVLRVGELRTFERDDDGAEGHVINVDAADETGTVRLAFWDDHAQALVNEQLEPGTVLRVKGRPKEGFNGLEVSVLQAEEDPDAEIDVCVQDTYRVEDLSLGLSDVTLRGTVLDTGSVRTFDRDDGSEGRVANLTLGDETGRVRVTLWDDRAEDVETISSGVTVEVIDGYIRERDGTLELHVGDRGILEEVDATVEYVPDATPIESLEIGQTVDIAGVIRSGDPIRTFERKDGTEGQVRNVRLQDETGDIRVAIWGEKADRELAAGDKVCFTDVEIKDGWQEDIEASVGWRSTITRLAPPHSDTPPASDDATDLSSFGGSIDDDETSGETDSMDERMAESATEADGDRVEFTGTVIQTGAPLILDNGEETVTIDTDTTVTLGQEITVRGTRGDDHIDAEEVF